MPGKTLTKFVNDSDSRVVGRTLWGPSAPNGNGPWAGINPGGLGSTRAPIHREPDVEYPPRCNP
jgi:hypothetical protein